MVNHYLYMDSLFFFFTYYTQSHHNLAKNYIKSLVILKFFKKNLINSTLWVFSLNIAKFGVYLRYRYCSKLFRELKKESEFRQRCCRNSTKVWEKKRKSGREKILNFGNHITEIPTAQTCWPSGCEVLEVWSAQRETNCGNAIAEIRGKKFLWQCHCRKWEKKNSGCRNLGRN